MTASKVTKGFFFLIYLIAPILVCADQQSPFEMQFSYLSSEDGLDTDECNFTFQDKHGFLWVGTNEGIFRYDGYDLINLDQLTKGGQVSKLKYFDAVEGVSDDLWFATSKGILHYQRESKTVNYIKKTEEVDLEIGWNSISCTSDGVLWLGGFDGLFSYDTKYHVIEKHHVNLGDRKISPSVRDIVVDGDQLWIATWGNGLGRFDLKTRHYETFKIFNRGNNVSKYNILYTLHLDSKGQIWAGTWDGGLYVVKPNSDKKPIIKKWFNRSAKDANCLIGNIIYDIEEDAKGNIWVGTPYGVSILEKGDFKQPKFYNFSHSVKSRALNNNEVRGILSDKTGLIWLATSGGGINKIQLKDHLYHTYGITQVDSLKKSQSVFSFGKDNKGRLLVGVQSLGFGVYDLETSRFRHFSEYPEYKSLTDLNINTIKSFNWDTKGNLWLGTRYRGLVKYSLESGEYYSISNGIANQTYSIRTVNKVKLDLNDNIWLVSNDAFYQVIQGQSNQFKDFKVKKIDIISKGTKNIINSRPQDFDIDNKGYIYLATIDGVIWKSENSIYNYSGEIRFEPLLLNHNSRRIDVVYADDVGNVWLGGDSGIQVYNTGEGLELNESYLSEIRNLKVYSLLEEDEKIVALSNKGLAIIDLKDGQKKINLLTSDDGLQGNVFIKGAIFKQGHQFFAGGHNGFNVLDISKVKFDETVPNINFTYVSTTKNDYYNTGDFTSESPLLVHHDDNAITITFAALDLRNSDNLYYAYKLEGLDQQWNYVSSNNRTATYANLNPGDYSFLVKSTNAKGEWGGNQNVLPIFVETAPYLTWWAYSIYTTIVLGILWGIFVLYSRQAKAKEDLRVESVERSKSEKLNHFKLQFFTNLSHELLTPLSVLMVVAQKWTLNEQTENRKEVKILNSNVHKLHQHIKQMLHFRKAETGNMTLNLNEGNVSVLFDELYENYSMVAADKEIQLDFDIEKNIVGKVDLEKIEMVANNLVSNAIKYTGKNGRVKVSLAKHETAAHGEIYIKVADNGRGIPKEHLENIFNRFYRLSVQDQFEDGLGIGLALTNHLVDLQSGKIRVESEVGKGTVFHVYLPLKGCNELSSKPLSSFFQNAEIEVLNLEPKAKFGDLSEIKYSGKRILVVEDNADFLVLVETYLSQYYKVLTAENGVEALEIANNNEIDLIVSDLTLPEMDGYELCRKIKSDVNTSHIPFVVVTARIEDHERLIGYESGADSYLTKPLDLRVLIYRMEALLKGREKVHDEFNTGAFLEPKKIATTSIDEDFLMKAKEIVENNISEPDFTVKILCEELGMSNSMFYRKIKGILDLTPNEFIKNIRLRRAAQLLGNKEINISEVAYMTGFNDLSYFGVCFKKQYDVTPSVFQKEVSQSNYENAG
ncbi:hybrid sensor histidine kinase/response regulator transcription factor [Echinicola shivajiensis]|uniref:hybrid sensor histidine kinase/response regulator transcription factor n=1 Tax=Echinicola shivajiensis TaxID=1035916 RepID=UPI001BFC8B25|nr:hybrid sensor histidine kinase/response regulator transcription factor [Echinicola shivajiensis]